MSLLLSPLSVVFGVVLLVTPAAGTVTSSPDHQITASSSDILTAIFDGLIDMCMDSANEIVAKELVNQRKRTTAYIQVELHQATEELTKGQERLQQQMTLLQVQHQAELATLRDQVTSGHQEEMATLRDQLASGHREAMATLRDQLASAHQEEMAILRDQLASGHQEEMATLRDQLASGHREEMATLRDQLASAHQEELTTLRDQLASGHQEELATLRDQLASAHQEELATLRDQLASAHQEELATLREQLAGLQQQMEALQRERIPVQTARRTAPRGCPGGWSRSGRHCYLVPALKASWSTARELCPTFDSRAHLASVHKENWNHVKSLVRYGDGSVWLGLYRSGLNRWTWTDGSPLDFTNWDYGEPNNGGWFGETERCALMLRGGSWNDEGCSYSMKFICQITLG